MRTTIDIPDDLYRQAKSQAALRGVHLRELIEEALRQELGMSAPSEEGFRAPFPLVRSQGAGVLTSEAVRQALHELEQEDDARRGGAV